MLSRRDMRSPDTTVRPLPRGERPALWAYVRGASIASVLTLPAIYALTLPLALLDLFVTVYQHLCFRVYGLARVPRRRYIVFDRNRLPYLNVVEKANCAYCSYANGVLAYAREVAARTETYWCPIKHAGYVRGTHRRYRSFFNYGDVQGYRRGMAQARRSVTRRRGHGERGT